VRLQALPVGQALMDQRMADAEAMIPDWAGRIKPLHAGEPVQGATPVGQLVRRRRAG